jgi:putative flippase GtrA
VVGVPLNLVITSFVHEVLGRSPELAFAVALICVFTYNFFACRHIIFRATTGDPRRQMVKYAGLSGLLRLVEYLGFLVVHAILNVQYLLAAIIVLGTSFFLKYHLYGKLVFTDGRNRAS